MGEGTDGGGKSGPYRNVRPAGDGVPILLGKSSRVSGLFRDSPKEYVFVLRVHGDVTGSEVESVFDEFEGEIYQRPPVTSSVSRRVRKRTIHSLDLLEREEDHVLGKVGCEAGTYIRKLCHDLGLALGTRGHMAELRRISTGTFEVEDAVYLQDLVDALALWRERDDETNLRRMIDPIEHALSEYPSLTVKESAVDAIAHGAPLYAPGVIGHSAEENERAVVFSSSGDA
ncbi:MAG: RNA-guided pseudouridylation complex pseudouridine synthase subunit Cbf5, partial [Halobacteria archaeon]|nr:RNA-guided pseudouridylation complex pseudouridine synthase subunit Cbf5 [Halobacteria archaeon]